MPNRIIANRYELLKITGRGGMSTVYLASDINLNKNWAIKEIKKYSVLGGQRVQASLLAEAELMKDLDHPTLPRIIDIIDEDNCYYIVMDFVEGETLRTVIDTSGPASQEQVVQWAKELGEVLKYLHSQNPPIIYRDMKPGNIILQPTGRIKLIDFGIARTYKTGQAQDTAPLGTKGYAAPEQYDLGDGQSAQSDERTDIYNLGVTLYELLTGKQPNKPPYKILPIREINPKLSAGLEKIIWTCTRDNPSERFQSMDEFLTALMNYQKMDDSFIYKQKNKIKRAILPMVLGIFLILAGTGTLIANNIMVANTYDSLISETGNPKTHIENLEKAIELDPSKGEAYKLLIKEYAKTNELSQNSDEVLSVCTKGLNELDKGSREYLDINYMLGESYLVYYSGETDKSLRNKIMTAAPFFSAVAESGNKDYENYEISKAYKSLSDFYEEYILESGDTFVFDAGKKDYEKLLKECSNAIDILDKNHSRSSSQLKISTYTIILNIIDSKRSNMATCIEKEKVLAVVGEIEKSIKPLTTTSADLLKQKEDIERACEIEKKAIEKSYKEAKKLEQKGK